MEIHLDQRAGGVVIVREGKLPAGNPLPGEIIGQQGGLGGLAAAIQPLYHIQLVFHILSSSFPFIAGTVNEINHHRRDEHHTRRRKKPHALGRPVLHQPQKAGRRQHQRHDQKRQIPPEAFEHTPKRPG